MIHEIIQRNRKIGRYNVSTYTRQIVKANIIEVEAGTNGHCGGDSGHGSRTFIRIEDAGGSDLNIKPTADGVIIEIGGDSELDTIIAAFKFVVKVLKDQRKAYGNPYE